MPRNFSGGSSAFGAFLRGIAPAIPEIKERRRQEEADELNRTMQAYGLLRGIAQEEKADERAEAALRRESADRWLSLIPSETEVDSDALREQYGPEFETHIAPFLGGAEKYGPVAEDGKPMGRWETGPSVKLPTAQEQQRRETENRRLLERSQDRALQADERAERRAGVLADRYGKGLVDEETAALLEEYYPGDVIPSPFGTFKKETLAQEDRRKQLEAQQRQEKLQLEEIARGITQAEEARAHQSFITASTLISPIDPEDFQEQDIDPVTNQPIRGSFSWGIGGKKAYEDAQNERFNKILELGQEIGGVFSPEQVHTIRQKLGIPEPITTARIAGDAARAAAAERAAAARAESSPTETQEQILSMDEERISDANDPRILGMGHYIQKYLDDLQEASGGPFSPEAIAENVPGWSEDLIRPTPEDINQTAGQVGQVVERIAAEDPTIGGFLNAQGTDPNTALDVPITAPLQEPPPPPPDVPVNNFVMPDMGLLSQRADIDPAMLEAARQGDPDALATIQSMSENWPPDVTEEVLRIISSGSMNRF